MGNGVAAGSTPAPSNGTFIDPDAVVDCANATLTLPAIEPAAAGVKRTSSAHVLFGLRLPRQLPETVKSAGVTVTDVIVSAAEPRLVSSKLRSMLGSPTSW